jgi:hypothetical protein
MLLTAVPEAAAMAAEAREIRERLGVSNALSTSGLPC